jgi:hypothetical protein
MAQRESQSRMTSPFKGAVVQAERLSRSQAELFAKIQEVNRHWLERVQSEETPAAEFARKVASARSVPDAATVYQEWASQQLKLAVEDASYAISTGEALIGYGIATAGGRGQGQRLDRVYVGGNQERPSGRPLVLRLGRWLPLDNRFPPKCLAKAPASSG